MSEPVAVGLVGAGPWARFAHAPMLAAGPETTLAGVWARRQQAAMQVLHDHGAPVFDSFDHLLDACDAVAFAVPPDVQVPLAVRAAERGKAVLLEKPVALDIDGARRVADAVGEAGVGSLVVLTYRFTADVEAFLASSEALDPDGGRAAFVSGALLDGPFSASPWRKEHGALFDLGPHVLDLVDAALGPVVEVRARRSYDGGWIGLLLDHEGGAASEVSISARSGVEPPSLTVEAYGRDGAASVDAMAALGPGTFAALRSRVAQVVRHPAAGDPLDVHRGVHLQRLLADAKRSASEG